MRLLWTLMKAVLVLALVIPASIIALAVALGIFGALLGLAVLTIKIAVVGLIAYGALRLAVSLFGGSASRSRPPEMKSLSPVDPYYDAAQRELDRELGEVRP